MKLLALPMLRRLSVWAPLILRVAIGLVFFTHGWQKLTVFTPAGIAGSMLKDWPVPIFWAWLLTLTEVVGGAGLILGAFTRLFATLNAIDMAVVILWLKLPAGAGIMATQGADGGPGTPGFELELLLFAGALAIAWRGAGKYSVDHMIGLDVDPGV